MKSRKKKIYTFCTFSQCHILNPSTVAWNALLQEDGIFFIWKNNRIKRLIFLRIYYNMEI